MQKKNKITVGKFS